MILLFDNSQFNMKNTVPYFFCVDSYTKVKYFYKLI